MNVPLDSILNFTELRNTVILANTPGFLYTRFRADFSIELLARNEPVEVLLADLYESLNGSTETLDDLVRIYALCIALSFKPYGEIIRLHSLSSKKVDWFNDIKVLVFEDAPKTQYVEVDLHQKPVVTIQDSVPSAIQFHQIPSEPSR